MTGRTPILALVVAVIVLVPLTGCDTPSAPDSAVLASEPASLDRRADVTVPFKASAYTSLVSLVPDPACGAPPRFLNTQVGEGEATHLGRFTVTFTFCVDATDLLDDGTLTAGESAPYDNGVGIIVTANGDELYMTAEGAVLPSDDPDYDFEFHEPFTFTGGTGRFENASGQGVNDGYVVQAEDRTDHVWSGWLTMVPGI
jgi:hypothetical protein